MKITDIYTLESLNFRNVCEGVDCKLCPFLVDVKTDKAETIKNVCRLSVWLTNNRYTNAKDAYNRGFDDGMRALKLHLEMCAEESNDYDIGYDIGYETGRTDFMQEVQFILNRFKDDNTVAYEINYLLCREKKNQKEKREGKND